MYFLLYVWYLEFCLPMFTNELRIDQPYLSDWLGMTQQYCKLD